MSFATVIDALSMPADARVDKRVPKKLLLEQGAPTAADKRQIQDGIEDIYWVAALKPTNIGVPEYRDKVREYQEIAVVTVTMRGAAKASRLTELIHRAIPYPVFLVDRQAERISMSLAHKRWSQGETGKVVIEKLRRAALLYLDHPSAEESRFLASLALSILPAGNLYVLYQAWLDRVVAMEAAMITGSFAPPDSAARSTALHEAIETYAQLQHDLNGLRAEAVREKQLNRRVVLNVEIKRLEGNLAEIAECLKGRDILSYNSESGLRSPPNIKDLKIKE